jgi:hypothetical protein
MPADNTTSGIETNLDNHVPIYLLRWSPEHCYLIPASAHRFQSTESIYTSTRRNCTFVHESCPPKKKKDPEHPPSPTPTRKFQPRQQPTVTSRLCQPCLPNLGMQCDRRNYKPRNLQTRIRELIASSRLSWRSYCFEGLRLISAGLLMER